MLHHGRNRPAPTVRETCHAYRLPTAAALAGAALLGTVLTATPAAAGPIDDGIEKAATFVEDAGQQLSVEDAAKGLEDGELLG